MSMEIASEILRQMGGNPFLRMVGGVAANDDGKLRVKFKGCNKTNIVYITLTPSDDYVMSFYKYSGLNLKLVEEKSGVYADGLQKVFIEITGLDTRL